MNSRPILPNLITIILIMTISHSSASEEPEISASVLNRLEEESVPAGVYAVSNIKRIESKITFDPKGNAGLPPFSKMAINPDPANGTTNFIVVKVTETATGSIVPVKVSAHERSAEDGKETLGMTIEILEDENIRQNKIQTFIDEVKNDQSTVPGAESQELVNEMNAKNADIVASLKNLYSENRVGSYNLTLEYHSTQQGAWTGQVTSVPIVLQVLNKGSFFDLIRTP